MSEQKLKHVMLYSIALLLLAGLFTVAKQTDLYCLAKAKFVFAGEDKAADDHSESKLLPEAAQAGGNFTADEDADVWELFFGLTDAEFVEQLGKNCIVLSKEAAGENIQIEEQQITASLQILLSDCTDYLGTDYIYRICSENCYSARPDGMEQKALTEREAPVKREEQEGRDVLTAVMQESQKDAEGILLTLVLDTVYEVFLYEDDWYYYISLKRPAELYEKIVVLDAGHGGIDPGTSSPGYVHQEKETNLTVILYTKELLDNRTDIKTYYTRTTDWKPSLEQRAAFANAVQTDLFISVHCNYNERRSVKGIEVLYNSAQNGKLPLDSKRLSQICLDKLSEDLGLYKRGIIDRKDNVYIVGYSEAPVALIELGYMSNTTDLAVLISEEARRTAAESICKAIDAAFAEMEDRD